MIVHEQFTLNRLLLTTPFFSSKTYQSGSVLPLFSVELYDEQDTNIGLRLWKLIQERSAKNQEVWSTVGDLLGGRSGGVACPCCCMPHPHLYTVNPEKITSIILNDFINVANLTSI